MLIHMKQLPPLPLGEESLQRIYPARHEQEKRRQCGTFNRRGPPQAPNPLGSLAPFAQPKQRPPALLWSCSGVTKPPTWLKSVEVAPPSAFKLFETGDRFFIATGDARDRQVVIAQSFDVSHSGCCRSEEIANRLTEALQAAWAARSAGAHDQLALSLPRGLDPQLFQSHLIRLIRRIAQASGIREVHYRDAGLCAVTGIKADDFFAETAQQIQHCESRERAHALRDMTLLAR